MTIKTIIVEDSRLARNELKELIKHHPELEVIGEAENVDDAYELITSLQPHLIFLDINMPGKDGFDLLEMLDDVPITVFTTAFDEYAIKSFEYNALDYLLKPISDKRFADAVEKVKAKLAAPAATGLQDPDASPQASGLLTENSQIFIKDGEKCWLVKLSEVQLFEIVGNYTRVYFADNKPLIYKSLNQVEERLPQHLFFRANRQQVINLQFIKNVDNWFNGKLRAIMNNGTEVEISRRQSALFKEMLSL
ncbi:transcriptional regulator [Flavobacterium akiainvivens]|uniref:Transcriptional regulator n=1 Tax=Flavobacterium akiainvivens TaxID=1202724 RepID=A0A0M9VJN8_9FLAO|nr:LytTR family DNA-binding domain-containing protein [Flavobacterium akiainvivens]KOS07976.1 transcriptional regulator [Flavobacterium akiainvivens]SFQ61468.1 two component transcriptional regulator, LytTR family [Flavobacterium akiainvivens]